MRNISVSTEVFAKIWSQRIDGEESEDEILTRILGLKGDASKTFSQESQVSSKINWRDDVKLALNNIGGKSHLKNIYSEVRSIRLKNGRSVPKNLAAIVRKELEHCSSDSNSFKGKHDWFQSVSGIGSGIWALRDEIAP